MVTTKFVMSDLGLLFEGILLVYQFTSKSRARGIMKNDTAAAVPAAAVAVLLAVGSILAMASIISGGGAFHSKDGISMPFKNNMAIDVLHEMKMVDVNNDDDILHSTTSQNYTSVTTTNSATAPTLSPIKERIYMIREPTDNQEVTIVQTSTLTTYKMKFDAAHPPHANRRRSSIEMRDIQNTGENGRKVFMQAGLDRRQRAWES